AERTSAEHMDMQVEHRLAGACAIANVKAEVRQPFLRRQPVGHQQQVAEQGLVLLSGITEFRDWLIRDPQAVDRRLRVDVADRQRMLVFVDDIGGDLPVDDLGKDGLRHSLLLSPNRKYGPRARASLKDVPGAHRHRPVWSFTTPAFTLGKSGPT